MPEVPEWQKTGMYSLLSTAEAESIFRRRLLCLGSVPLAYSAYKAGGVDLDDPRIAVTYDTTTKVLYCPICDKSYDLANAQTNIVSQTMYRHLASVSHVCRVSGVFGIKRSDIEAHFPFQCMVCERKYLRDESAKLHETRCRKRHASSVDNQGNPGSPESSLKEEEVEDGELQDEAMPNSMDKTALDVHEHSQPRPPASQAFSPESPTHTDELPESSLSPPPSSWTHREFLTTPQLDLSSDLEAFSHDSSTSQQDTGTESPRPDSHSSIDQDTSPNPTHRGRRSRRVRIQNAIRHRSRSPERTIEHSPRPAYVVRTPQGDMIGHVYPCQLPSSSPAQHTSQPPPPPPPSPVPQSQEEVTQATVNRMLDLMQEQNHLWRVLSRQLEEAQESVESVWTLPGGDSGPSSAMDLD